MVFMIYKDLVFCISHSIGYNWHALVLAYQNFKKTQAFESSIGIGQFVKAL